MKKYLEFVDEKSSKFWEIEVVDSLVRVRFGKIGTPGTVSEKSYGSQGEATTATQKQIAEKIKKGYAELGSKPKVDTGFRFVDKEEFEQKYRPQIDSQLYAESSYNRYLVCDGDAKLSDNWVMEEKIPGLEYPDGTTMLSNVIYVKGNLEIDGSIVNSGDNIFLWVGGDLKAKDMLCQNSTFVICGNTTLSGVLCGDDNNGIFECRGTTKAKLFLSNEHFFDCRKTDYLYNDDDFGEYDEDEFKQLIKDGIILKGVCHWESDNFNKTITHLIYHCKEVLTPQARSSDKIENQADSSVEIELKEVGMLATVLADEKYAHITQLKIVGVMNKKDMSALKKIGKRLEVVDLGDVTCNGKLPDRLFENGKKLTKFIMPKGLVSIGKSAFENCEKLTEINIPDGVKVIESRAFYDCKLTTVVLPDSVETYATAFDGNPLKSITLPKTLTKLQSVRVSYDSKLKSFEIPDTITEIGRLGFESCKLREIVVPPKVVVIEDYAFSDLGTLESVVIPASVREVGISLFMNCWKLKSVVIDAPLKSLPGRMFNNCESLTSITIPPTVEQIGGFVFEGCKSLETLTIPASVKSIGQSLIAHCPNLKLVIFESPMPPVVDVNVFLKSDKLRRPAPWQIREQKDAWSNFIATYTSPDVELKFPESYLEDPMWSEALAKFKEVDC